MRRIGQTLSLIIGMAMACHAALGQTTAPATQPAPFITTLVVHPAALPSPVMKYRLMTPLYEQTPGDAAPIYMEAIKGLARVPDEIQQTESQYEDMPMPELARSKEVDKLLAAYADVFHQIKLATSCDECRFDARMSVTEIGGFRGLYYALLTQLRVEIARSQYEAAAATCREMFVLAHNSRGNLLYALSGDAFAQDTIDQMKEMEQQPGAPNLYGALADLPRPFFDFSELLQKEQSKVLTMIPEFKEAGHGPLKPEEWKDVMAHFTLYCLLDNPFPNYSKLVITVHGGPPQLASLFPNAKSYDIEHHLLPEAQGDDAPSSEVVGVYLFARYQETFDQMYVAARLPYPQALEILHRDQERLGPVSKEDTFPYNNPFLLAKSFSMPLYALGGVDRQAALDQCVEAIRAYAAGHDGKPPRRLEDMTDPPAPPNPTTGQPFNYTAHGQEAEIEIRPPPGFDKSPGTLVRLTITP